MAESSHITEVLSDITIAEDLSKKVMENAYKGLQSLGDTAHAVGQRVASEVKSAADAFYAVGAAIKESVGAMGSLTKSIAGANTAEFGEKLTRLKESLKGVKNAISESMMPFITGFSDRMATFISEVRGQVDGVVKDIKGSAEEIGEAFKLAWQRFKEQFASREALEKFVENPSQFFYSVIENLKGAFEGIVETGKWSWEKIKSIFTSKEGPGLRSAFESIIESAKWSWEKIKSIFTGEEGPSPGEMDLAGTTFGAGMAAMNTEKDKTMGMLFSESSDTVAPASGGADPSKDLMVEDEQVATIMNELSDPANAYEEGLAGIDEYYIARISKLQQYGATEAQIKEAQRQHEITRDKYVANTKIKLASQAFGNLSKMAYSFYKESGKQSKAAFLAYKAMSIAETIVSTIKSAQDAFAWGMKYGGPAAPAVAAAAAAAAIVAGMARVQAIASQQIGGGEGGAAGAASTGTGASQSPVTPTSPVEGINAGAPAGPSFQVVIQGDVYGDEDALVERISKSLEEAVSDRRISFA